MKKKTNFHMPSKYVLLFVTLFCAALIFLTYSVDKVSGPIRTVANYTIIPMQKGLNQIGLWIEDRGNYFVDLNATLEENARLQEELEELKVTNSEILLKRSEYERMQELLELKDEYSDYETVGAKVINKGAENWFNTFIINKGSEDGIEKDMNVITKGGLVGIVITVGPDWAQVRSIIDDSSSVSSMMLSSSDPCFIRGDLKLLNEGEIRFEQLENNENEIAEGEQVVTSNTSEKFLPGFLVGYVTDISVDANNLTRSGTVTPAVDFKQLQEVLVVKTLKKQIDIE